MKISAKQYAQVLYELTRGKSEGEAGVVIEKFAGELARNKQLSLVQKIIENFEKIYNQENGILEAKVESAFELGENEIEKVKKYLLEKYKVEEIVLENKINSEVKGGVIIKTGDEILDLSVAGNLNRLKKELIN